MTGLCEHTRDCDTGEVSGDAQVGWREEYSKVFMSEIGTVESGRPKSQSSTIPSTNPGDERYHHLGGGSINTAGAQNTQE